MSMLALAAPVLGIVALLFAYSLSAKASKQDAGTDRMKEIAAFIHEGAQAFLMAEYKILVVFVKMKQAVVLAPQGTGQQQIARFLVRSNVFKPCYFQPVQMGTVRFFRNANLLLHGIPPLMDFCMG